MALSQSMFCKGCWQNMHLPIAIRGPLSIPFRLAGIRPSRMNPNLCTICEAHFTKVKRSKQIAVSTTVLFADLRGYSNTSQNVGASEVTNMLNVFYDECASAIWERDGIVNKFLGDAVLAVFNFPIMQKDHIRQAVLAGVEIQRSCQGGSSLTVKTSEGQSHSMGIGIGIHTGDVSVGEIGTAYRDFTIIGPVVNIASRIQGTAKAGEILVTAEVYQHVADLFPGSACHAYQLKGIDAPVTGYLLNTSPLFPQ